MEPTRTDTERLTQLGALLRTRPEMIEFWFDPSVPVYFAGEHMGDTIQAALDRLLDDEAP